MQVEQLLGLRANVQVLHPVQQGKHLLFAPTKNPSLHKSQTPAKVEQIMQLVLAWPHKIQTFPFKE